ncbi:cytochrome b/b6 domain-containing protein [Microbacterium hydrocarbonoxydans]|nr:cytochrome b/b6 domain-containing protein [Microbacterium hydrocarbonoxydans]
MAERMLRRGLPRTPGGEPWPPAGVVEVAGVEAPEGSDTPGVDTPHVGPVVGVRPGSGVSAPDVAAPHLAEAPVAGRAEREETQAASPDVASVVEPGGAPSAPGPSPSSRGVRSLRRGLPRVPGGEPWPPFGPIDDAVEARVVERATHPPAFERAERDETLSSPRVVDAHPVVERAERNQTPTAVRRGLPRTSGGEPWPPADTVPRTVHRSLDASVAVHAAEDPCSAARSATGTETTTPVATRIATGSETAPAPGSAVATADVSSPLPWTKTVWDGRAPRHVAAAPASASRRPTWPQAIAGLFGAAALGILAGAAVAFVRALLSLPFMQDFLAAFPGEYEPAVHVEPGFAPWIGWQHFFNVFLMVLIIRSGLRIRTEKRPTAFWTPRNNPKGKTSLTIWFHQALDILWLVNGVIFVVLLFTTGHWARIVPTSWEVFPNALSAALQYLSFDWPHENGWNNYNSLQQIAYFATVFLAAPLAAVTGFRMSGMWPKKAERLSKAYPIEWARAVHFPVMLYFVAFIIVHVALVFLTGFLRNLNHMYAAQDAVTWTGFWVFVASMVVIAIGWVAARPLVIAPIARLFGNVSGR